MEDRVRAIPENAGEFDLLSENAIRRIGTTPIDFSLLTPIARHFDGDSDKDQAIIIAVGISIVVSFLWITYRACCA